MNTFMEEILFSNAGSDISRLNHEFFTKKISDEKMSNLIKVFYSYINIINLLKNQNRSFSERKLTELRNFINNRNEKVEKINSEIKKSQKEKEKIDSTLYNLYNGQTTDFEIIRKLEDQLEKINSALKPKVKDMELTINESREALSQIAELEAEKVAYDASVRDAIKNLRIHTEKLDKEFSGRFDLDSMRKEYEYRLRTIINSGETREVYCDYLFSFLKKEIKMLTSTAKLANRFQRDANLENEFTIEGMDFENERIMAFIELDNITHNAMNNLVNVWGKSASADTISESYARVKNIIELLMEAVVRKDMVLTSEYSEVFNYYQTIQKEKEELASRNFLYDLFSLKSYGSTKQLEELGLDYGIYFFERWNNSDFVDLLLKKNEELNHELREEKEIEITIEQEESKDLEPTELIIIEEDFFDDDIVEEIFDDVEIREKLRSF